MHYSILRGVTRSEDRASIIRPVLEFSCRIHKKTTIDSLHKLANEHYRLQRYQEARSAWEEVLKLDPDDPQAGALIERADRVIQKLQSLHQEDGNGPDPQ